MLPRLHRSASRLPNPVRFFSQTPIAPSKPLPPRIKINDADISISYLKGTGPGGQKIVRDSWTRTSCTAIVAWESVENTTQD